MGCAWKLRKLGKPDRMAPIPSQVIEQVRKTQEGLPANYKKLIESRAIQPPKVGDLANVCFNNAGLALLSITEEALQKASVAQRAVVAGIMLEKGQMLAGKPTTIIGYAQRQKIEDVAVALQEELRRRGKLIDVTATQVS